ncbi:MAG: S8 family serine peptidase [Anaeromyxobacteraceae bacterium]
MLPNHVARLAVALAIATSSQALAAPKLRPSAVQGRITTTFVPIGAAGDRAVTVVLELAGDPVAVIQAGRAAPLAERDRNAIARALEVQQDAVADHVRSRGGRVLAQFQHALNGVKVQVKLRDVAALSSLPGVVAVRPVRVFRPNIVQNPDNAVSVPFIGAPAAWEGVNGVRGEKVKVAIIDTGIDYTHANFGGPGTPADYTAAHAAETAPANPALFGPGAPKVKGGTDLVGDAYDADDPTSVPVPDPNPLDCNGHGSHVAGTAAGFGVTGDGRTYAGPYTAAAVANNAWRIGPGVAPKADLYAVRVFGCNGSTNVVVDAIEWAVKNGMDVVNMSLGSPFGSSDSADALAAENAARAGVLVVASSGNSGQELYLTGSPATGNGVISVAAVDSTERFPAATLTLSPSGSILAQNSNGAPLPSGALPIVVLRNPDGTVSLGCDEAEYVDAAITGKLVVALRGVCARVDRATFGDRHGAAAVAMINTSDAYPPFEGDIPGVTLPFLGVKSSDGAALAAAASTTLAPATLANPAFRVLADFTSGGPRSKDSILKPTITAPGVSIQSTAVGTGNQGERLSGTSMAAPHVTGTAALVRQAHATWAVEDQRAAIVSTADAAKVLDYEARLAGAGLVQPATAVATQVVAVAQATGALNLSFGFAELGRDFHGEQVITVRNHGRSAAVLQATSTPTTTVPHAVELSPSRVVVPPGREALVRVRLTVPAATAGNTDFFREVAGLVSLAPQTPNGNGGVALAVPYYLVPRARADVAARLSAPLAASAGSLSARVENSAESRVAGSADFYAWGASGLGTGATPVDMRALGVQALDIPGVGRTLVFAVNLFQRFSTAAVDEFDVLLDVDGDGTADFDVFSIDLGLLTAGDFNGQLIVGVQDLATGDISGSPFAPFAANDGATLLLPVPAASVNVGAANPRFAYAAQSLSFDTGDADTTGVGLFNAFTPAVETGQFASVAPGERATVPVSVNAAEFAKTAPKGLMIVEVEDRAGAAQAELIPVGAVRPAAAR